MYEAKVFTKLIAIRFILKKILMFELTTEIWGRNFFKSMKL